MALSQSINTRMNEDDRYRRKQISRHPQIVVRFFELRTQQYVDDILGPIWGVTDHFFRYEFAEGRGQIHFHGLFWRGDRRPHGLFQEADTDIDEFQKQFGEFMVNLGFSANHVSNDKSQWAPPEGTMNRPNDPNVLRKSFQELSGVDPDTLTLVNQTGGT